jgi:hypothetical protein
LASAPDDISARACRRSGRHAPISRGYFLGDYEGLASIGTTFTSLFSETTATDKDNTYLATIAPSP